MQILKQENTKEEIDYILNKTVKTWFYSRFKEYSIPQKFAVLKIHSRKNILISAPTGATKTLTSFLSILNELVDSSEKNILENKTYCIYVSPLKSLNNDIKKNLTTPLEEIKKLSNIDIRIGLRTGDTTQKEKTNMLKNAPHILITTPESLSTLLTSKKFKENLKKVEWLIIDEIHSFAENKRGVQLNILTEYLEKLSPGICRIGLSATVSPIKEIAKFLVGENRDCDIVDVNYIKKKDIKLITPVKNFLDEDFSSLEKNLYNTIDKLIQEHKTTLIFTNTRSATERVVHHLTEKFPGKYSTIQDYKKIGAHHSSLSKEHRLEIEQGLRDGKLKCVVCSTSLELGIDIGYIDLVILLSSPKSVARALQRIGRAGHQLNSITKGRIVAIDRDDLVECSILLKNSLENKIDNIHIPTNSLDVLSQAIIAATLIFGPINIHELFKIAKESYCYSKTTFKDFYEIIEFLSGEKIELEKRHIYAKIYFDKETNIISSRGKLARMIYMTNSGTIPDSTSITVKIGENVLGVVEEAFVENLKPGDIFVLGGSCYQFKFTRGQTAQVNAAHNKRPTVPNWFSQMLPLSFDLATDIGKFRRLISESIESESKTIQFIKEYSFTNETEAKAIYNYVKTQKEYAQIPTDKEILIEKYVDQDTNQIYFIFHSLFGRRVNDCFSRAVAHAISRKIHKDVEIGINDNCFYLSTNKEISTDEIENILYLLSQENLYEIMNSAIEKTEILMRRFRHCATRSFLILRTYQGTRKNVGRQQISSKIIFNAAKEIDKNFVIIREAKREVLEDLMDIKNTQFILEQINKKRIKISKTSTQIPSPFAANLILQGFSDILKASDKLEYLKKMHQMVLAKIALKSRKKIEIKSNFDYNEFWEKENKKEELELFNKKEKILRELKKISENFDPIFKRDLTKIFSGDYHKIKTKSYYMLEELLKEELEKDLKNFLEKAKKEIEKLNEDII